MSLYDDIASSGKFFLIAGPCVVESEDICMEVARTVKAICDDLGILYIFKSSFRKANRTRMDSFTGIGDAEALSILQRVREQVSVPVITDIHEVKEVKMVADCVDMLQIPAFLCRQTDLLLAAGHTGLPINIKKGQFLSGTAMKYAAEKVTGSGNQNILLTERGNSFGYGDLIVDLRNIVEMKAIGYPVILDATHAVQRPNTSDGVSGGNPQYIAALAKAGAAVGIDGLFLECHPNPSKARSDGSNMLPLSAVETILKDVSAIRNAL